MANTITNLFPELYNALDVVSRELVGFIPSVTMDAQYSRASKDQTVRSPVAPAAAAGDLTPAAASPDDGNQTIGNTSTTISKVRRVPVRWNGEQSLSLNNNGADLNVLMRDQFAQAMRTLTNEIEADLGALHIGASRAYGTAGTTPFATAGNFTDASHAAKILKDNGAPVTGNSLVIDTTAGANLIGLQSRTDIAGQDTMLRQGVLLDTAGFAIRESAGIATSTAGDAASYVTDAGATYPVGTTTIHVDTGTGDVLAGDVITFAGDTNKYVVATGYTGDGDSDVVIAAPGLRETLADGVAMTVVAAAARNLAFSRSAIALATRVPALPSGGDAATDRQIITDPRSGISFEVSQYPQYRQMQYEISIAYGVAMVKPEHCAILLG